MNLQQCTFPYRNQCHPQPNKPVVTITDTAGYNFRIQTKIYYFIWDLKILFFFFQFIYSRLFVCGVSLLASPVQSTRLGTQMESSFGRGLGSLAESMGCVSTVIGFFRSSTLSKILLCALSFTAFPKLPPLWPQRQVLLSQQVSDLLCRTQQNKRYDPKGVTPKIWNRRYNSKSPGTPQGRGHSHQE